jgi:hypothetical protein
MTKKYKIIIRVILILIGVAILSFIGFILFFIYAMGVFDKDYSVTELKENFEKNKIQIYELKHYFNNIVSKHRFVEIEFENSTTLFRFGIEALDTTVGNPYGPQYLDWDVNINSNKVDSVIKPLGWSRETLNKIKYKLDKADCIQIESGEPTKIGFKRSGLGMYSFIVFDYPIPDSLKSKNNDGKTYILVNDYLALEFSGGAAGPQGFYNKD